MMLDLEVARQALKFLKRMQPKHQKQVKTKIGALQLNPFPHDSIQLQNYAPYRRATCGEYRIVYRVDDEGKILIVSIIAKRNDDQVYKLLNRLQ